MGFTQFFTGVMTILGTLVFMIMINWKITLVVVLVTPLSFFVASFVAKKTYRMFSLQSDTRCEQTGLFEEMIGNEKVVQAYGHEDEALEKFEDIEKADSIALGDPASVPAGQYAQEALTNLGIWDKIQDKVSFGTNVTEVLNQVAAASADAGIVYATDAASMADQVEVVAEAPEGSLAKKVIYPVAVVKGTAHEEVAKEFVAFLQTDKAITVFEEYGFSSAQ